MSPRKPPREERDIDAAARNNRVVAFDNVSYLDGWLSDALCRLSTGSEIGGRSLYSDFDESVFAASRPVLLNGIPDVARAGDLADRCVRLEVWPPAERMPEVVFWHSFHRDWPVLQALAFDLLSATIRNWEEGGRRVAAVGPDVRMPEFARIGEAIGVELGWEPGAFTRRYADNQTAAASELARDDALFDPLRAVVAAHGGSWTGQHKELLRLLNAELDEQEGYRAPDVRRNKAAAWPETPTALTGRLARLAPALRAAGLEVGPSRRSNGTTTRTIRLC